jgi:hypothetical protein
MMLRFRQLGNRLRRHVEKSGEIAGGDLFVHATSLARTSASRETISSLAH